MYRPATKSVFAAIPERSFTIGVTDTKRDRFRGRIGTGGQGVVLKVWDAKLSRPSCAGAVG